MAEEKIVGVTFPVPYRFMKRFFEDGKDVFVKPATAFKRLKEGMKLIFYASHENQGWVGEATIKRVEFVDDPFEVLRGYEDRLFLTKEELRAYMKSQEKWGGGKRRGKKKKWLVMELENITRYKNIVRPKRFITVGGRYVTQREFKKTFRQTGLNNCHL